MHTKGLRSNILWWWTDLLRSRRICHTSDTVPLPLSLVVVVPPLSPVRHCRSSTRPVSPNYSQTAVQGCMQSTLPQLVLGDAEQQPLRGVAATTGFPQDTRSTPSFSSTAATGCKPSHDGLLSARTPQGSAGEGCYVPSSPCSCNARPRENKAAGSSQFFSTSSTESPLARIPLGPRARSYPSRAANR